MIEVLDNENTVEIPLEEYERLVSLETRVNVAAEYALKEDNASIEMIMFLLGTPTAIEAEKKYSKDRLREGECVSES